MLAEMHKTWLEVALNGPWGKARQPGIPVRVADIVAEGIACAREGAAIVHVHAYDEASGRQHDSAELYARIIEGIRREVDCIVYPTIPFAGRETGAAERFAAIEELGRRGLLEWAVVDPGSVNLDDIVYLNPDAHVRHGLALASRFGFPPAQYALDAYLRLLADEAPGAPWMAAGLAVDILAIAEAAVARGGHLRVGLEDAPFGSARGNRDWVTAGRRAIERAGGELASAAEVRAALS